MSKNAKVLVVSLIVLLSLVCIYQRKPLGRFLVNTGHNISAWAGNVHDDIKQWQADRAAKKEEKRLAKLEEEALNRQKFIEAVDRLKAEAEGPESTVSAEIYDSAELIENRNFSGEELALINQQNGVVLTAQDGSRYITITTVDDNAEPVMRYMLILDSVDGQYFRHTDEMVYSCGETQLFDSPSMVHTALISSEWEGFKRTGISAEGVYQLVTQDGKILYANGKNFRRYRENMDTTEEITLPAERVELEVQHISQNPSLPNGCEITSLAMVLGYLDFDISKESLSDNYLPKAPIGQANFYDEFVGDPREDSSYGCYAGAIVNAANSFLASKGSNLKAVDYSGANFQTVLEKVRQGNPVVVWATAYINQDPGYSTEWWVDGEYLVWKANLHCMVVSGYDTEKGVVIVQDPMRGREEYDMELFIKRYKQFYSQAVVIE